MDKKKTKKKNGAFKNTLAGIGIGLVLGFVIGFILVAEPGVTDPASDEGSMNFFLRFGVAMLFFYTGYIFQILLHEGGHLIAGLMSGYKFMSYRVFNVIFYNADGRIQRKRFSIPGTAGQCLMIPPEPVDGSFPYLLYNLGGVIVNLLTGCLFLVLYIVLPAMHHTPATLLLVFAAAGILTGLMNLIPFKMGGVANDGYNIRVLSKRKEARNAFRIMLLAGANLLAGVRFKDMTAEFAEEPVDINDPISASIAIYHYNYLNDIHDFENARLFAERMLNETDNMLDLQKNALRCELLYYELIGERREEEIERLYTKELKKFIKAAGSLLSVQRLLYAIAKLVDFNETEAEKILAKFNKGCAVYPHAGEVENEREMIEYIDKAAEALGKVS